jgi:hypothetical protein
MMIAQLIAFKNAVRFEGILKFVEKCENTRWVLNWYCRSVILPVSRYLPIGSKSKIK